MPYVFTEQGIAMLSAVLRSDVAINVSIRIMNAFVESRHFMTNNSMLFERLKTDEVKQLQYQKRTDESLEQIFEYISDHEESSQKVFFDGQIYDAFSLLIGLIQKAEMEIVLVDGYVDVGTLNILSEIDPASPCFKESQNLAKTVESKVNAEEKKQYDFQMKQYNDAVSLEKQRINAIKDIAVSYYKSQTTDINYTLIVK